MKNGLNTISSIIKGSTPIQIIKKGLTTVYEAFKNLIVSGAFPISLPNSIGRDLVDYKIEGNSTQEINLFSKKSMVTGYLPETGAYPTTNSSCPRASYQIIELKAGQKVKIKTYAGFTIYGRVRYIDSETNEVVGTVGAGTTEYYISTASQASNFSDAEITALKDFKLGVMWLDAITFAFKLDIIYIPLPNNPVEIRSTGDKTQNLLNYKFAVPTTDTTVTFVDNGFHVAGSYGAIVKNIKVKPNTNYYLQFKRSNLVGERKLVTIYPNQTTSTAISYIRVDTGGTFNTGEYEEIQIYFYGGGNSSVEGEATYTDIQLKEGTEATDYEPYGYRIPIISRGKNLIPYPWDSNSNDYFTIKNDGGIEVNADAIEKYRDFTFHRNGTLKAGTYIYSGGHENLLFIFNYVDKNNVNQWLNLGLNVPLTISEDINYKRMYLQINPNKEVKGTFYIQLEKGATATEYEPYIEPITTDIYLDEPLRKVGSYADYIDFENKQLVRQMGETAVEISMVVTLSNGNTGGIFNLANKLGDGNSEGKCERAIYNYSHEPNTFYENPSNFVLVGDSTDTLDSLKAKYNGSKILYRHAEPIKEIIDLPNIPTFKGTTVIDSNAEVIPSNAEIEYIGK